MMVRATYMRVLRIFHVRFSVVLPIGNTVIIKLPRERFEMNNANTEELGRIVANAMSNFLSRPDHTNTNHSASG